MKLGIDTLLENRHLQEQLRGRRIGLLGHPASLTSAGQHTLDALISLPGVVLPCAFGPQHGMRGDKQDNMIESADYTDPLHKIPVFSLYGQTRRPSEQMLSDCDVILIDLQDIGTRIYTYLTTLIYMMQACAEYNKSVWVLDRPNPAGRPLEGLILEAGWISFVGAAPIITRHGMTLGEIARWYAGQMKQELDLRIIRMADYWPDQPPGYGWPLHDLCWVNPSPNASSLNMARCFPGTVLIEGTTLSEGRGTTVPLEVVGAPDIDINRIVEQMRALRADWMEGVLVRTCFFEPTFHKHAHELCAGFQLHTDYARYSHNNFRPFRLVALFLKALRTVHPRYKLWRQIEYEYETDRPAIDLISGGPFLRQWVDDAAAGPDMLEKRLQKDEIRWSQERQKYLLY